MLSKALLAAAIGAGTLAAVSVTPAQAAPTAHITVPSVVTGQPAVQPVYWTRDRWGHRVWVEDHPHHPHGWVDRWGHWHPD